jgi:hypothetical protein
MARLTRLNAPTFNDDSVQAKPQVIDDHGGFRKAAG